MNHAYIYTVLIPLFIIASFAAFCESLGITIHDLVCVTALHLLEKKAW